MECHRATRVERGVFQRVFGVALLVGGLGVATLGTFVTAGPAGADTAPCTPPPTDEAPVVSAFSVDCPPPTTSTPPTSIDPCTPPTDNGPNLSASVDCPPPTTPSTVLDPCAANACVYAPAPTTAAPTTTADPTTTTEAVPVVQRDVAPPTTTGAVVLGAQLARTGSRIGPLTSIGLGLVALGLLALTFTGRRRGHES